MSGILLVANSRAASQKKMVEILGAKAEVLDEKGRLFEGTVISCEVDMDKPFQLSTISMLSDNNGIITAGIASVTIINKSAHYAKQATLLSKYVGFLGHYKNKSLCFSVGMVLEEGIPKLTILCEQYGTLEDADWETVTLTIPDLFSYRWDTQ